jgi:flagellar basal-body rod modification protein FlgD
MATVDSATSAGAIAAGQAAADNSSNAVSSKPGLEQTANKETFLKLLVAQIKNQDPLNPTDATQFLTQLAQFSQLEQLINIRSSIDDLTGKISESSNLNGNGQTASEPQQSAQK